MVPFFLVAVLGGHHGTGFGIFLAAGLTDAADGLMARYFRQQSRIGAILDPLADKLLLTAAFVTLALPPRPRPFPEFDPLNRIPAELVILTLGRDLLIVLFAAVVWLAAGTAEFPPTILGKLHTAVSSTTVAVVLGYNAAGVVSTRLVPALLWLTLATTLVSGSHYLYRSLRHPPGGAAP